MDSSWVDTGCFLVLLVIAASALSLCITVELKARIEALSAPVPEPEPVVESEPEEMIALDEIDIIEIAVFDPSEGEEARRTLAMMLTMVRVDREINEILARCNF